MNSYRTSNGERLNKSVIDARVRNAKKAKIASFINEYGYIFCEECKRSDLTPIDCSHIISVDQCQKQGRSELAYNVNNIRLLCRSCHIKHDTNQCR